MTASSAASAVVLVSGGGSNLQAMIDSMHRNALSVDIRAVISNVPDAYALTRARNAGIAAVAIDHKHFRDRAAFDAALAASLDGYAPDLILLAGFMRILTPSFVNRYAGRILNIHPSLLPKYPGLNTHQRALDAGDHEHGVTVHFVTAELDGGPPVLQGRVPVLPGDNAKSLAARVLEVEHRIYPAAVGLVAERRLAFRDGVAMLDGRPLTAPIEFPCGDAPAWPPERLRSSGE